MKLSITSDPLLLNGTCEGRLTLTTATPVTTTDVTSAGTIYFTPYKGNRISLYNGSAWKVYSFSELSLALTATSGKNYDVFVYDNAGTLTLELSDAWTNDTTRDDALALQDGVYVKSGSTTRRWLGTIRASGTNVCEDSAAKRFVWNYYNRVLRAVRGTTETTDTWDYTTDAWRQANANTANQFEYVAGIAEDAISVKVATGANNTGSSAIFSVGIGISSSTVNSAQVLFSGASIGVLNNFVTIESNYVGVPGMGYFSIRWLERSTAFGVTTFRGDLSNPTIYQAGIFGILMA